MVEAVELIARAAALGFGLEADAFTRLMIEGPHLLAPTGSNLQQHGQLGTVLAGRRVLSGRWGDGAQESKDVLQLQAVTCVHRSGLAGDALQSGGGA